MRNLIAALPLALLAVPATAATTRDERPIACIYQHTRYMPRAELVPLVKNGFQATSGPEKVLALRFGQVVGSCRQNNGWGQKRSDAAYRFFTGRVLREDAAYRGAGLGLTEERIDAAMAKLPAASRAEVATGRVSPEVVRASLAELKAGGMAVDTLAQPDLATLAETLGQGLIGTAMMTDAEAAFARG